MDKYLMPDWMRKAKDTAELERLRASEAVRDQRIAQMMVSSGSEEFWRELLKNLAKQVEYLPDTFGLKGTVNVSDSENSEKLCRVDASLYAAFPRSAYVNLFYRPGGTVVRCWPELGTSEDLSFGVVDGRVALLIGERYRSSEDSASRIIQDLVRVVKPDARF